jgi:superfamily II DNA or RNA helicase
MQILRTGDLVLVRRARWRIADIRTFESCRVITLAGAASPHGDVERCVLSPFDIVEPIARRSTPRLVGARRWRRACRALIAGDTPAGSLRAARRARIDLLPHQLAPALAIVRGLATRALLADEVGLGKTIQAGLVAAELLELGACRRILVITPAGLRDQWALELSGRFGIAAAVVDGPLLRRAATELPIGLSPWLTLPVAIASVDYVKRPEVLPAVSACMWELVVVDEAHGVAGDSDRRAAVHALAARASYVLLLTATPHNGDAHAFRSLCGIGAVDDTPLVVFRRTRGAVGAGVRRRVHLLRVRASGDERRMHAVLAGYGNALHAERVRHGRAVPLLALAVLHKRAFSSAWSLAASIERRLAVLADPDHEMPGEQLALPLTDPSGDLLTGDEPPAWPHDLQFADAALERRRLIALLSAARGAAGRETKLVRLDTLLRRVREPAIVFTEYRDTLAHVVGRLKRPAIVLHGGLRRDERVAALDAFAAAPHALLLATDAAAEGLNLHEHCRLVVNLELPWNPMRLEQRIGRVDRIGQRRTVHAIHLVAADTGEARVADRLRARLSAAAAEVGTPDPLDGDERHVAESVLSTGGHDELADR